MKNKKENDDKIVKNIDEAIDKLDEIKEFFQDDDEDKSSDMYTINHLGYRKIASEGKFSLWISTRDSYDKFVLYRSDTEEHNHYQMITMFENIIKDSETEEIIGYRYGRVIFLCKKGCKPYNLLDRMSTKILMKNFIDKIQKQVDEFKDKHNIVERKCKEHGEVV